ncbi:serine protease [Streptomyces sp. AJS327]|nr:serine protease [Streptomyces sp. AJS327]
MKAKDMWKVSQGEGVTVAVIDTGVDSSTSSLRGQVLKGKDVSGAKGDAHTDSTGHGTTMAELIAGTGEGGLRGLAPKAKILPIRTGLEGVKNDEFFSTDPKAVRAAAQSEARIINMSFGSEVRGEDLRQATEYAARKGKLLFAASGNDGMRNEKANYPAGFHKVVGVGSVDVSGKVSEYSGSGQHVDLSAPGSNIPGWCDEKMESYCDGDGGTSAATAIASASAALIWSKHPDWTANQVLRVLIDTAGAKDGKKEIASKYIGFGAVRPRLNLLEGKGDPGPRDRFPIAKDGTFDGNPAPDSPKDGSAQDERSGSEADEGRRDGAEAAASGSGGDGGVPWLLVGVGAGIVAVLAAGAAVLGRRRAGRV